MKLIKNISEKDWNIFYSNYELSKDELLEIFPYVVNYEEYNQLLLNSRSETIFNNKFSEILFRFPNTLTKDEMTKIYQYFLLENWHHSHEDIISQLQFIMMRN